MSCPDIGTWRAWLDDQEPNRASELSDHLGACPVCQDRVGDLRRGARFAATSVATLAPAAVPAAASIALARERLAAALVASPIPNAHDPTPRRQLPVTRLVARWRIAASGLAAALALTVLVGTSDGQAAAARFLAQFRSDRIAVIPFQTTELNNPLSQLERLGRVPGAPGAGRGNLEPARARRGQTVASVAEASQLVGFPVKAPDAAALPAGLSPTPRVRVLPAAEFRFTFEKAMAAQYLKELGRADVQIPNKFDGATLVVGMPATAMLEYAADDGRGKAIVIGQAGQVTAGVEGNVTLEELRDFLLGLPGLPAGAVAQLRALQDWRSTLPVPVPVDKVDWQSTAVNGQPGVMLNDRTGLGAGVLWQQDGRIYGVAGTATGPEILRVASALR